MKRVYLGVIAVSLLLTIGLAFLMIGCASDGPLSSQSSGEFGRPSSSGQKDADSDGIADRAGGREELWVIQRPTSKLESSGSEVTSVVGSPTFADDRILLPADDGDDSSVAASQPLPGIGGLMTRLSNKTLVAIPLKHTDVKASIAGYIATTDVTQQFQNPYDTKIEAVYVFPLPHDAAVSEFVMTIGDRRIRGIIRERAEAERIYKEARSQGYVASLLTQERPNIFTQSVANIEPGKSIDVNIKYFNTLAYADGYYEYVFPMVVGPRFNPPGSTGGVGAKDHGAPAGTTGQKTEVSYLKPGERSGHDISLNVRVDAGVKIESVESTNHKVKVTTDSPSLQTIALDASDASDAIPNKDFVLRFKVVGEQMKSAVIAQKTETGGYFTVMLYPPATMDDLPRQPLELVFTLDVSGSMSGAPMEQARAAIKYALTHMRADDTFQIIRFAGGAEKLASEPLAATEQNVRRGLQFIEATDAGGGTMMIEGIRGSLVFPHDENRLRFVTFLTDGFIGNEREILTEVHRSIGPSRIFSFGVGSSTNRYLLDSMAKAGRGAVAYLGLMDDATTVMGGFFNRIAHPAMTDVSISTNTGGVVETYPKRIPDLFVGKPVTISGRYEGKLGKTITLRGKIGNQMRELEIPVGDASNSALANVWARAKIADLYDQSAITDMPDIDQTVKQVALDYGLMSSFTAFVAVDSSAVTSGDHGVSVAVPVPVPDGVKYETTVTER